MRIVYTRALKKKPPSGSRVKNKTWYLLENISFLKPFINITLEKTLPVNLPSSPINEESEVFREENSTEPNSTDISDDFENATHNGSSSCIIGINSDTINTTSQNTLGPPKKKNKTQVDTDECIINYIQSKSSQQPTEDNAKKLFLLSLLPDLEEMSTAQFRTFRRDVVDLIDRSLEQPSNHQYPT